MTHSIVTASSPVFCFSVSRFLFPFLHGSSEHEGSTDHTHIHTHTIGIEGTLACPCCRPMTYIRRRSVQCTSVQQQNHGPDRRERETIRRPDRLWMAVTNGNFQSGLWKFTEISIVLQSLNGIPFMKVDISMEISTCKFPKWKFPFLRWRGREKYACVTGRLCTVSRGECPVMD